MTDNITNDSTFGNVVSSAESQYTSSGINQTKQNTIISTQKVTVEPISVSEQKHDVQHSVVVNRTVLGTTYTPDPIVQTVDIKVPDVSGVFVTKLDLFFQAKHSTLPIVVDIREMEGTQNVSNRIVPFSRVVKYPADITLSDDSSEATTFVFDSPVFLKNGETYAIHIQAAANNPDYKLWISKLGETDLLTETNISVQPYVGVILASSNDTVWSPVQDEDLKFTLYRAVFNTGVTGTAILNNEDMDYMTLENMEGYITIADEPVFGETRLTLNTANTSNILVGQTAYQAASNASGIITSVSGSVIRVKDVPLAYKYVTGQTITYKYANNTNTGVTTGVTSIAIPKGFKKYQFGDQLHVGRTNSTAFIDGEQIIGQFSGNDADIVSLDELKINVYNPVIANLEFPLTKLVWSSKLTSNTGVLESSWTDIVVNENNLTNSEMALYSVSDDDDSFRIKAVMTSQSDYLSPAIDTNKSSSILVQNIINNDSTGETNPKGGNAKAKYLHKKVVLAEGQDAEDIVVRFAAYKPSTSDIKVYYKILNGEDGNIIDDLNWYEMEISKDKFSNIENLRDFVDLMYVIPAANLIGLNDAVQYTNADGVDFSGFKTVVVKVVMLTDNSSKVPRFKDLQITFLQK